MSIPFRIRGLVNPEPSDNRSGEIRPENDFLKKVSFGGFGCAMFSSEANGLEEPREVEFNLTQLYLPAGFEHVDYPREKLCHKEGGRFNMQDFKRSRKPLQKALCLPLLTHVYTSNFTGAMERKHLCETLPEDHPEKLGSKACAALSAADPVIFYSTVPIIDLLGRDRHYFMPILLDNQSIIHYAMGDLLVDNVLDRISDLRGQLQPGQVVMAGINDINGHDDLGILYATDVFFENVKFPS